MRSTQPLSTAIGLLIIAASVTTVVAWAPTAELTLLRVVLWFVALYLSLVRAWRSLR
jgi:hypothetical protein